MTPFPSPPHICTWNSKEFFYIFLVGFWDEKKVLRSNGRWLIALKLQSWMFYTQLSFNILFLHATIC